MPFLNGQSNKNDRNLLTQLGLLTAIPALMAAGPLIGYFAGDWADDWLGTTPFLTILGVAFGFGAAGIEVYNIIKKAISLENNENKKDSG